MSELLTANTLGELTEVINNNDRVVVEFGASWCGPCRTFLPHFTKFAEKHPEISAVKVDIEVDPEVVSTYKIQSVPQVMLFERGEYARHLDARTVLQLEQEIA